MLTYIAQLFLDWLTRGPWRNPDGHGFYGTRDFSPDQVLPAIWDDVITAHWGFVFAIIVAILMWFMMRYTLRGFEVVVLGQSDRAGRFAGFSAKKMVWFGFLLSGALAGLAGISEVSGSIGHLQPDISPSYGFTAIIVAFLGRLNPLGIIASGLVLALTYIGGESRSRLSAFLTRSRFPRTASLLRTLLRHADLLQDPYCSMRARTHVEAAS